MKRKDNSILKMIANSYVILPLSDHNISVDVILNTNEVGAFIYEALETETTKEEILSKLLEVYEIDKDVASKDIDNFLNKLAEKGLLDV